MLTETQKQEISQNTKMQVEMHQFPLQYIEAELARAEKLKEEMEYYHLCLLAELWSLLQSSEHGTSSKSGYRSSRLVDLEKVKQFVVEMEKGMTPIMKVGPYRICICDECCPPGPL